MKIIAVIGASGMGRWFARTAAVAGYGVVFEDVSREMLERGILWIRESLEESVGRGELSAVARDEALSRIVLAGTVESAIREAELVIEAVPDELEMKLELFTIFDKFGKPGAIFASSTATLSVLEISDVTVCRERCVGMRFRDEARAAEEIELVLTRLTSEETARVCREVAARLARKVVELADTGAAA